MKTHYHDPHEVIGVIILPDGRFRRVRRKDNVAFTAAYDDSSDYNYGPHISDKWPNRRTPLRHTVVLNWRIIAEGVKITRGKCRRSPIPLYICRSEA